MAIKTNIEMQYERDLETYIIENVKKCIFVLGFIFKKTQVNFYIQEHFLKQKSHLMFC